MSINRIKKIFTFGVAILTSFSIFSIIPNNNIEVNAASNADINYNSTYYFDEYENYLKDKSSTNSNSEIILNSETAKLLGAERLNEYAGEKNLIKFFGNGESAIWNINVQKADFYEIYFTYIPLNKKNIDIKVSISFDDSYPYSALSDLTLARLWQNKTNSIEKDKDGNDIIPEQVMSSSFVTDVAEDKSGIVLEPYKVYLEAGNHQIKLTAKSESVAVKEIKLSAYKEVKAYKDVFDSSKKSENSTRIIYIEGEKANLKSSNAMAPKSDVGCELTPNSPIYDLINNIGGTTWQMAGDTLYWDFNVEKSGYYKLAFNYMQNDVINGTSFRWIKIDGQTPFKELKNIKFSYCTKWQYVKFESPEREPYYIWLDKGNHTLSMEVTISEISEYYKRLQKIVEVLSDTYMEIVMITGETPDVRRDYELFKQIPNLNNTLKDIYKELNDLSKDIQNSSGENSNQYVASFNNMARVVKNMVDNPYMAHQYVKDYYTNYCTVSSWLYDMLEMPLRLDQIQLVPMNKEYPGVNSGFFKSLGYSFKRFLVSFSNDYNNQEANNNSELELWVNWGIDQSKALISLIQQSFTEETGIEVNVRVTNASLVNGILSGNYPDLSLHLARTEPVNLGIRGALYDLKQFDDYEQVTERFQKDASVPYTYNGKVYALPDTQGFYIMFYRTDILNELDIPLPKTWDDFIKAATILQRKNMQIYIPYTQITTTTTVNTGIGGLNLYATLMAQNGVDIYNKEQTACQINTNEAISVFKFWTELYTDYKYLKEADFYNRFRVGSMPLGIAPYATYMTLEDAAPEIKGKWDIACVPGNADGSYAVAGSGTGCSIIKKSSHKKEAWEFLKWWTSADTQLRYSNNVESSLGAVGRQITSNVEAFKNLSWSNDSEQVLLEQWSRVKEVPEIPGSYYLTRAVDQAFWAVLNDGKEYKSTMNKWNDIANGEISRKINEYE